MNTFFILISFLIFVILQSFFINGVKYSMGKGMILEGLSNWLRIKLGDYWFKPFGGCVACMASVYGTISYWAAILPIFGANVYEIEIWIFDIFILVSINFIIYKQL